MKKLVGGLVLVAVLACSVSAGELATNEQKTGYALGLILSQQAAQMFGPALKMVDVPSMAEGFIDGIKGGDLKLKEEEINTVLQDLNKKMTEEVGKQVEAMKKVAAVNAEKAREFLDKNKSVDGIKTTETGMQYQMLKEGTGKTPKEGDEVTVHYVGTLLDGKEFDSSVKRGQPFTFALPGQVITGWNEALPLIKEGGKIKIYLPSELGYGEFGSPPVIEPGAALVFEIELLKVETPSATPAAAPEKK